MPLGIGNGISASFKKGGINWSSYWTALKEAMTSKPPTAYAVAANTFLKSLDDGGILAIGDRLFMFTPHTNANGEALLDILHPTGTPAVLTNGSGGAIPTFQSYNGFMGNIVKKSILNTQYNPATAGDKFTQNEASLVAYVWDMPSYSGANRTMGNHGSKLWLAAKYASNYIRGSCNSTSGNATNSGAALVAPNLVASVRKNATTENKYRGDTNLGDETFASGAIVNANITMLSVEGTYFEDSQVAIAFIGGLLSQAQITIFKNACDTFMNTISPDVDATKTIISEEADDLYAHESQILIKQIGGVDYLFMNYMSNKVTTEEWATTSHAKLKVYNLSTMTLVKTFDLWYPGLVAGVTLPADKEINAPKMYLYGAGTLRCFVNNTGTLYTRDINISDSDPDNWTAGNASIAQMTMKDGAGADALLDVTSANLQGHCEDVFADTYAGYENLMPHFRNMEIAVSSNDWYATLECSGERSHTLAGPTFLVKSADAGNTWSIIAPIAYTTASRAQLIEPGVIFIGTDLHIVSRGTLVKHYKSVDSGVTWTTETDLPLPMNTPSISKPSVINYTDGTLKNIIATSITSQIEGDTGRTTVRIFSTEDFLIFQKLARIRTATYCSYPSLCYYNGSVYMSYSSGSPGDYTKERIALVKIDL